MFGLEDNIIELIRTQITKFCDVDDIIIYGSRAKGNYKKGSDIDIAIKGNTITFEKVVWLKTLFNQEIPIPYRIDIIHFDTITNNELIDHIDRVGISILQQ